MFVSLCYLRNCLRRDMIGDTARTSRGVRSGSSDNMMFQDGMLLYGENGMRYRGVGAGSDGMGDDRRVIELPTGGVGVVVVAFSYVQRVRA